MGNGCMSINAVKTVDAPTPKFKLIVVGDTGVGKTSVIQRYARNFFSSEYIPTELLNIESVVRKLSIPDQGIVTVELWDVPTCDELSTRKTYYMDTDAVIVVVDVCDEDIAEISNQWRLDAVTNIVTSKGELSLENGIKNQPQVEKSHHSPKAGSIPVLLLGNKFDI
uniref:Small monomeric GTPase n=1 Tax=Ciona savignyi TaxID=51511 RepID=H2Z0D8_CIOSA